MGLTDIARNVPSIDGVAHTAKTVPTEIQSPKSAEIKSVYVAFHVHTQFQRPVPGSVVSRLNL